jgi:hypothetical protein
MIALILCLASFTHAAELTDPGSLKSNMGEMGARFRLVFRQAADPALNLKSAELANEIAQLARFSQVHLPEQIERAPDGVEKLLQAARFRSLLSEVYTVLTQAEIALLENKNPEAQVLLKKAADLQKAGHGEFKPREGER